MCGTASFYKSALLQPLCTSICSVFTAVPPTDSNMYTVYYMCSLAVLRPVCYLFSARLCTRTGAPCACMSLCAYVCLCVLSSLLESHVLCGSCEDLLSGRPVLARLSVCVCLHVSVYVSVWVCVCTRSPLR
jgi:hypothetical protein